MQNRQALIRITVPEEKQEIYDLAYGDYTVAEEAAGQVQITRPQIDLHDLNESLELVSYFAAMFRAQNEGILKPFLTHDIKGAIAKYYDRDYFYDTEIAISSPGSITLRAKHLALPAFLSAMLALTGSVQDVAQAQAVKISNSKRSGNPACEMEVSERVRDALNMMHHDLYKKMCEARQAGREKVGIESGVTVKEKPKNKK